MEDILYKIALHNREADVKLILRRNPDLNVNWVDRFGQTVLHRACEKGHDAITRILLSHPGIDVNLRDVYGHTPLLLASLFQHAGCVGLLLRDSRVNCLPGERGVGLKWAAEKGSVDIVRLWVATGRMFPPELWCAGAITTARSPAWRKLNETQEEYVMRQKANVDTATLLERFVEEPEETMHAVRAELRWYNLLASEMFAVVVFVSDGLLEVTQGEKATTPAARFFTIAQKLPLELQMVLCYRLVGSGQEVIIGTHSEAAFKALARRF